MTWALVVDTIGRLAEAWAFRVFLALLTAIIWLRVAQSTRRSIDLTLTRTTNDPNARELAGRLVYGGVLLLGAVWVLGVAGVELAAIVATFGVIGLAFSLAVQDILKSFFAGVYLLFERPFVIGDEIQVKDHIGRVEKIGFRATSIRTKDDILVVVPNAVFFTEAVQNRSVRERPGQREGEQS